MRLLIAIVLLLAAFGLAFMFANQNEQTIQLNYLFGETSIQLVLLITICLALGLIIGLLMSGISLMKTRVQLKNSRKKLAKAEQELKNLRSLPVKEEL
ncbi:lipopolysaccharide assembly protein LapA domain-containing protein [Kangiella sp. TOML190]|uniref:lipopolysaccharide assembly protein LapA domain-containing protein n=1 Tax=Kangiella sp. TOML190 TaxID=2931351 RepID=UPI00203CDFB1|nr:LapA family protein [Kangiella sp. TOML190]